MKVKSILFGFLSLALVGCAREKLSVRTEYMTFERLASYHVDTPDPLKYCPELGQRICVDWFLPKCYLDYDDLHLHILVRLRNREDDEVNVPINTTSGNYCYYLLNEDYFNSCGILTYKVELIGCDKVLDEWCHQLWVNIINFDGNDAVLETKDDYKTPDGIFDDEVWDWK